ncbi:hypothetical protein [Enterococcus caccae]|uniref:hypothetical protein n=1 Tax=Enterococcus caccae TaxID=317735 RepID=UPI001471CB23|nr:hypothetical protein [Enterococcus caccae]
MIKPKIKNLSGENATTFCPASNQDQFLVLQLKAVSLQDIEIQFAIELLAARFVYLTGG